jgi:hypothetical protein
VPPAVAATDQSAQVAVRNQISAARSSGRCSAKFCAGRSLRGPPGLHDGLVAEQSAGRDPGDVSATVRSVHEAGHLVSAVLDDPDNDLEQIARAFVASSDPCWHIDRHVVGVVDVDAKRPAIAEACEAAIALAIKWAAQNVSSNWSGCLVSAPFVFLDDEWLEGVANATPPHVYICLARDEHSFEPVWSGPDVDVEASGNAIVDSLPRGKVRLSRVEGAFEDVPGGWALGPFT